MQEYWVNSDGENVAIRHMDDNYIANCLNNIGKLHGRVSSKEAAIDTYHNVFGPWWTVNHADEYIKAFNFELDVRKRIKSKEYPIINITPICDDCQNRISCNLEKPCSNWELSPYSLYKYLEGIDLEVAKRGYLVCNGIWYEAE